MLLNFMSLLNAIYIAAAHVVMALVVLYEIWKSGSDPLPLFKRLIWVFVLSLLLIFPVYALRIPQIVTLLSSMYTKPSSDFSPFSIEFIRELLVGISAGFGAGTVLAAVFLLFFVLFGLVVLFRKNFVVPVGLLLPAIFTGVHLQLKGMSISPRFFIYELFLALLAVVAALLFIGAEIEKYLKVAEKSRGRLGTIFVLAVILISAGSLRRYYQVPKQNYREAIRVLEEMRQPGQAAVIFHLAEKGIRYYSAHLNTVGGVEDYYYVRSSEKLLEILNSHPVGDVYIVTTLHRYLRHQYPDIDNMLRTQWERVRVFPSTVGDGQIFIWQIRKELL